MALSPRFSNVSYERLTTQPIVLFLVGENCFRQFSMKFIDVILRCGKYVHNRGSMCCVFYRINDLRWTIVHSLFLLYALSFSFHHFCRLQSEIERNRQAAYEANACDIYNIRYDRLFQSQIYVHIHAVCCSIEDFLPLIYYTIKSKKNSHRISHEKHVEVINEPRINIS